MELKAKEFEKKQNDLAIDYALRQKVSAFKIANEFDKPKIKDVIINSTIESLKSGYKLDFDENKNILFRTKEDNDVYEGNVKVSLEKYLEKELEPYIVKSNAPPVPPKPTTPVFISLRINHKHSKI